MTCFIGAGWKTCPWQYTLTHNKAEKRTKIQNVCFVAGESPTQKKCSDFSSTFPYLHRYNRCKLFCSFLPKSTKDKTAPLKFPSIISSAPAFSINCLAMTENENDFESGGPPTRTNDCKFASSHVSQLTKFCNKLYFQSLFHFIAHPLTDTHTVRGSGVVPLAVSGVRRAHGGCLVFI